MAYPTEFALNQSEAVNSGLWDGLVWLYLPGYSRTADIIGGDTLTNIGQTTLDTTSYATGTAEIFNLASRVGTAMPLEGTTSHTQVVFWRNLAAAGALPTGILGTAPTTTWSNVAQLLRVQSSGATRFVFRKANSELIVSDIYGIGSGQESITFAGRRTDGYTYIRTDSAAKNVSSTALAGAITSTEPVVLGMYYADDGRRTPMALFWSGIWDRELTTEEEDLIRSDRFAVFRKTAGTGNANAPGGTGTSVGSGSGGTATGGAAGSGTITIPAIKDLTTGALRSSQTGITVIFNDLTTGALVVKKTALTTDASGNCAVTDALLVAATTYRVTTILADGSEGTWKYAAA